MLENDTKPFSLDMVVFVPFEQRHLTKRHLQSQELRDGKLQNIVINGPANFDMWAECWHLISTAMCFFDVVDIGLPLHHKSKQEAYHKEHGDAAWLLQYQAGGRSRSEQLPRILKDIRIEHSRDPNHGRAARYDPKRPYNAAFAELVSDSEWWWTEFEKKALNYAAKVKALSEVVDGDAPAGPSPSVTAAPASKPVRSQPAVPLHTTSRKGKPLCPDWCKWGWCSGGKPGGECTKHAGHMHLCEVCLGNHPTKEHGQPRKPANRSEPPRKRRRG